MFSQDKISMTLPAGETCQNDLYFGAENDAAIKGTVFSTSRRIVPAFSGFQGQTIHLPYGVDTVGLASGDVIEGWLCFTTSVGEYRVPFEIRTESTHIRTTEGRTITMDEFAQTARKDFREAFRIFTSPDFEKIVNASDHRSRALYKGFSRQPVTYQHLEEFLISDGSKERVTVQCSEDRAEWYEVSEDTEQIFVITRSGWGHLRLEIETRGEFLETEKKVLTDEDFIGTRCELRYVIHAGKTARGRHFGRILVKSPYQTLELSVLATGLARTDFSLTMLEKKHRASLIRDYLDFLCGKIPFDEWAVGTHYSLNQLRDSGVDSPGYQMFEVWLLHQERKDPQAVEILKKYMKRAYNQNEAELAGTFLYMSLRCGLTDDQGQILSRLERLYMQKGDSFLLLWFLLKLDPELRHNEEKALYRMEEIFNRGCTSPFLYLEAWRKLISKPAVLHRLSDFWIQVFCFAARQELMNEDLSMRFAYLTGYEKSYRPLVTRVLEKCCEAFPSDDTLEALCKYIIRGNPRKPEYFRWFSRAVSRGLRLTRLYEYYVETMDMNSRKVLPRALLMYFKYNSDSLGDSKKAYIYANVIENKERDEATYELYRPHMEDFARQKVQAGRFNENYAAIYREFLMEPETPAQAAALARVMMTSRLYSDDPRIRQVIVRHDQLEREEIYPVTKGVAYPRIYTPDAVILFQDEKQRRYESTVEYSLTRLLGDSAVNDRVLALGSEEPGLLLHYTQTHTPRKENLGIFGRVSENEAFSLEYRREIRRKVLAYFMASAQGDDLDAFLKTLDFDEYVQVDKAGLLSVLISRGLFTQALRIIEEYGCEGVDGNDLVRLVSVTVSHSEGREDEELLALASQVYAAGYYDETIVAYLIERRSGPVSDLFALKASAEGFDMDTSAIEEKILTVLMFTEDYRKEGEDVLKSFLSHSGNEKTVGAYLSFLAYGTFVREYAMSPFLLQCLYRVYREKWPVDRICRLALFKELTRGKAEGIPVESIEKEMLAECVQNGMYFAFFRRLPSARLAQAGLDDKVIVELHENPEAQVTLFYRLDTGLGSEGQYRSEPAISMYPGIFGQCFSLFYGESIHYYFQVEKGESMVRTSERVLTMNRVENSAISKYQRINQMLNARRIGREQEVREKIRQYLRQEQYAEEFFHCT